MERLQGLKGRVEFDEHHLQPRPLAEGQVERDGEPDPPLPERRPLAVEVPCLVEEDDEVVDGLGLDPLSCLPDPDPVRTRRRRLSHRPRDRSE